MLLSNLMPGNRTPLKKYMDYILYLCFALVVLIIVNGVLYFIGGLIGLKNSQFRIAIPFGIIFLIVTFIGAFMGWW